MAVGGLILWFGVIIGVLGVIGLAGGAVIALAGPDAVDDVSEGGGGSGSDSGGGGVLGIGSGDASDPDGSRADRERAEARNTVRAAGVVAMGVGGAFLVLGGSLAVVGHIVRGRADRLQQSQQQTVIVNT